MSSSTRATTTTTRFAVKLAENARKQASANWSAFASSFVNQAAATSSAYAGPRSARLTPLFSPALLETAAKLVAQAKQRDPTYVPTDFSAWHKLSFEHDVAQRREHAVSADAIMDMDDDARAKAMDALPSRLFIMHLLSRSDVLAADLLPSGSDVEEPAAGGALAPTDAAAEDRLAHSPSATLRPEDFQGYMAAAPTGIDARYAYGHRGGNGAGIGFVHAWTGWKVDHEDLAAAKVTDVSGGPVTAELRADIGTAVLGIVLMTENAIGGMGIARAARGRVVEAFGNPVGAILTALASMQFGDVLLVGRTYDLGNDPPVYFPLEVAESGWEAIRLATALGVVVVEKTSLGGLGDDLDKLRSGAGRLWLNRASPDFRDSGAIMVGTATAAPPHARSWDYGVGGTSYGSRIDFYAWRDLIATTTVAYDDAGGRHDAYTTNFVGPGHGAAAIIAGAALALQGIARARFGRPLAPLDVRRLLAIGATPSAYPEFDRVGVMPNLKAVINAPEMRAPPAAGSAAT